MGRDKPKKYNKMNYQQKEVYVKNQLQQYGGGAVYRDNGGARGSASTGMFDLEASRNALEKKMRNDFDYRTSAQHMDDIKGDASMSDFVNYQRDAVKLHKKAGNEGSYSSNKDISGVTNNLVNDYRKTMASKDDLDQMSVDNQIEDAQSSTFTEPDYQESGHLKQAKERVQNFRDASSAGNNDEQRNQAASGFAKYKLNLG